MDLFDEACDDLSAIESKSDNLTVDQKIALAQVKALLSISQESPRRRVGRRVAVAADPGRPVEREGD